MNLRRLHYFFLGFVLLAGCAENNVPKCNSDEVKATLLSLIEESIMSNLKKIERGNEPKFKFGLLPSIDLLTTVKDKEKNAKSCEATITYRLPVDLGHVQNNFLGGKQSVTITVTYEVIKNETDKAGFYVRANGLDTGDAAFLQYGANGAIKAKVIDFPLQLNDSFAEVKGVLLQKGFVEDFSQQKNQSNCGQLGNYCKYQFKREKYFVAIETLVMVEDMYQGEKLLTGEIVTKWEIGEVN
jgi:hypothetical protein